MIKVRCMKCGTVGKKRGNSRTVESSLRAAALATSRGCAFCLLDDAPGKLLKRIRIQSPHPDFRVLPAERDNDPRNWAVIVLGQVNRTGDRGVARVRMVNRQDIGTHLSQCDMGLDQILRSSVIASLACKVVAKWMNGRNSRRD